MGLIPVLSARLFLYWCSSNDGDLEDGKRADRTCFLGAGIRRYGGPRYCLNGHKYHLSGWMESTTTTVDLSRGAFKGNIVAFVDRWALMESNKSGDSTLLKIPSAVGAETFVIYNRQKDFNDGVREGGDLVTVSQSLPNDPIESERLAMLDVYQSVTLPFTGIVVEICAKGGKMPVDWVTVSVYDTSRGQTSLCSPQYLLTTASSESMDAFFQGLGPQLTSQSPP
jgi:hypothetical protein